MSNIFTLQYASRPATGLAALAGRYAADPSSWPLAPRFNAASRWYARLGGDSGHEAWLLTWLPGQSTDLHDHGGSAGAFVVVSGVLTEQVVPVGEAGCVVPAVGEAGCVVPAVGEAGSVVAVGEAGSVVPREVTLGEGVARAFGPRHVHRIVNAGTAPAVSVHVYAPALREMTRYRLDDGVLSIAVVEQAGVDW